MADTGVANQEKIRASKECGRRARVGPGGVEVLPWGRRGGQAPGQRGMAAPQTWR
jgi:hypothetical protein